MSTFSFSAAAPASGSGGGSGGSSNDDDDDNKKLREELLNMRLENAKLMAENENLQAKISTPSVTSQLQVMLLLVYISFSY